MINDKDEIQRLKKALEEINGHAVTVFSATDQECRLLLEQCAEISDEALKT